MTFVRIIPEQRFTGVVAPSHRPYAFYADAYSFHGRTLADCYRLVRGLYLPQKDYIPKECRTPFVYDYDSGHDTDVPLFKINVSSNGKLIYDKYPFEWLEDTKYLVFEASIHENDEDLDPFPATWRALSYIVSDPERMGMRDLSWEMPLMDFARARIHALFREAHQAGGKGMLAEKYSKEELGLTDFQHLSEPQEELEYYHYLSINSTLTDEIVELFGISHRCWHGCGYLGWPGFPMCRFFLLKNKITPKIGVRLLGGRERFMCDDRLI